MRTELMARHLPPLPELLPETPLPLVEGWLAEARQEMRNATSMTLATVDPDGRPSARMVICRGFDVEAGWGGYRVWAERVELWVGQPARVHDRAEWIRALEPTDAGFSGGPWSSTRLQP